MTFRILAVLSLFVLAGCGSCLDPWTRLSDCPGGTPGHHSAK